jgi:hypothetical protein
MLSTEAIHTPRNSALGCAADKSARDKKQKRRDRFFIVTDEKVKIGKLVGQEELREL